jgi:hypothetical protein
MLSHGYTCASWVLFFPGLFPVYTLGVHSVCAGWMAAYQATPCVPTYVWFHFFTGVFMFWVRFSVHLTLELLGGGMGVQLIRCNHSNCLLSASLLLYFILICVWLHVCVESFV